MLDVMRRNAQSWGVKILFGLIILVFVFWGVGSYTSKRANVVGYVDDVSVSLAEFRKSHENQLGQMRQRFPNLNEELLRQLDFKRQVFNQMADTILMQKKAAELGLTVSDAEIASTIGQFPAFRNAAGDFDFDLYRRLLHGSGMTEGEFEASMRRDLMVGKLQEYVGAAVVVGEEEARERFLFARGQAVIDYVLYEGAAFQAKVTPSEEQLKASYEKNSAKYTEPAKIAIEYLRFTPADLADPKGFTDEQVAADYERSKDQFARAEAVNARHILVRVEENAPEDEARKALTKIQDIKKKIDTGMPFAEAATKFSEGPTAPRGGELGWFERGRMVGAFEDAAFAQPVGKVGEPVRSPFGYHLILVEEHRDAGIAPLDEVKDDIRMQLAREKGAERLADSLDEGLAQASANLPFADIAKNLGVPLEQSGLFNRTLGPAGIQLKPQDLEALFAMPTGTVAPKPLQIEEGYIIARKTEEVQERLKPLDEVRAQVEQDVVREEGKKLAMDAAAASLAKLRDPATAGKQLGDLKPLIKTSEPFGRQGSIPGLGASPDMSAKAFAGQPGVWLDQAFEASAGAYIARLNKLVPPSDEEWSSQKQQFIDSLAGSRRAEMFQAFLEELRGKAVIKIVNPEYLD